MMILRGLRTRWPGRGNPSEAGTRDGCLWMGVDADSRSENVQIVTGHKTAAISLPHLAHQVFLGRFDELVALVIQNQEARTRPRCEFSKLASRGVILAPHTLPLRRRFRVASICIDFVNQNVAPIALFDHAFTRSGIA